MRCCDAPELRTIGDCGSVTGFDLTLQKCRCGEYSMDFYWAGSNTQNPLPPSLADSVAVLRDGVLDALERLDETHEFRVEPEPIPDEPVCDLCRQPANGEMHSTRWWPVQQAVDAKWRPPRDRRMTIPVFQHRLAAIGHRRWELCDSCHGSLARRGARKKKD